MALMDFKLEDVGSIFTSLREAITGEKIQDPTKVMEMLNTLQGKFLEVQGKIISTEAGSEHWIVAAWRPITMLVFVFIIANNYILVPYMSAFGGTVVPLPLDQNMWDLLKIGLGGYVIGRSAEKVAKNWKK